MYCWICGNEVSEFQSYGVPPRTGRCPYCGAKPRGRVLGWLLKEVLVPALPDGGQILEVGASRFAVQVLLSPAFLGRHRCAVVDVRRLGFHQRLASPNVFVQMDLASLGFNDESFDLILCNNTLPYVSHDLRALSEIRRCLKPGGLALINTHREPGKTMSVREHRRLHPELGDDYYAANGDQRVYGEDFFDRVKQSGLHCRTAMVFNRRPQEFLHLNGLKKLNEIIFACRDPAALPSCRNPDLDMAGAS